MAENNNTYEEFRKQRLHENNQRLQELGLEKLSKNLAQLTNSDRKSQKLPKRKSKSSVLNIVEPRRSSRTRNSVPSYRDDVDIDLSFFHKRSRSTSSWASYLARPLEEVKSASYEERARALKVAEKLRSSLQSGFPSFVKSMVRSHVYSCFWLGLPKHFCKDHLPKTVTDMVLEDENGREFDANFIGQKTGLSGGWRAFALDHKLDDGDAVAFELVEPTRFKVYIIRASSLSNQEHNAIVIGKEGFMSNVNRTTKGGMKLDSQANHESEEMSNARELQPEKGMGSRGRKAADPAENKGSAPKTLNKKCKSANGSIVDKVVELVEEKDKRATLRPRKKPAPKLLRKKSDQRTGEGRL